MSKTQFESTCESLLQELEVCDCFNSKKSLFFFVCFKQRTLSSCCDYVSGADYMGRGWRN